MSIGYGVGSTAAGLVGAPGVIADLAGWFAANGRDGAASSAANHPPCSIVWQMRSPPAMIVPDVSAALSMGWSFGSEPIAPRGPTARAPSPVLREHLGSIKRKAASESSRFEAIRRFGRAPSHASARPASPRLAVRQLSDVAGWLSRGATARRAPTASVLSTCRPSLSPRPCAARRCSPPARAAPTVRARHGLPASLPISSTRNGETIDATTRFASSFSPARPLTSSLPRIRDPSQPAAASSPAHPS